MMLISRIYTAVQYVRPPKKKKRKKKRRHRHLPAASLGHPPQRWVLRKKGRTKKHRGRHGTDFLKASGVLRGYGEFRR